MGHEVPNKTNSTTAPKIAHPITNITITSLSHHHQPLIPSNHLTTPPLTYLTLPCPNTGQAPAYQQSFAAETPCNAS